MNGRGEGGREGGKEGRGRWREGIGRKEGGRDDEMREEDK